MHILNRFSILLLCWFLSIGFLFYIVEQEKPANQKFSFIKLFYSPTIEQSIPLMPGIQAPSLPAIKELAQRPHDTSLLPKGNLAGAGNIGTIEVKYHKNGNVTIILPYVGALKQYTSESFVKNAPRLEDTVHARILHFPGKWTADFLRQSLRAGYCARLIQMATHKDELRFSISSTYGIYGLYEEVRYTDSEIIIEVSSQKDAFR